MCTHVCIKQDIIIIIIIIIITTTATTIIKIIKMTINKDEVFTFKNFSVLEEL